LTQIPVFVDDTAKAAFKAIRCPAMSNDYSLFVFVLPLYH